MFFLAGSAASSALDLISALQQTVGSKSSSAPPSNSQSFDLGAATAASAGATASAGAPLAPATMDAMLSVQGQGQTPMVNGDAFSAQLFSLLDGNNDGAVSQSEFVTAFGQNGNTAKADGIFAQLDTNADGNVSPDELTNALSGQGQGGQGGQGEQADGAQGVHRHHHHHGMADLGGANSPMGGSGNTNTPFSSNASNDPFGSGDISQTVTNTDGSSTTTITYADGSQVSMTIPAPSSTGSNPSGMAHNFIERMIQHQAQMLASTTAGQTLAISA